MKSQTLSFKMNMGKIYDFFKIMKERNSKIDNFSIIIF